MVTQRIERVHSLPGEHLVNLSISQTLFGASLVVFLLLSVANAVGYDVQAKLLLAGWGALLLLASYLFYRRVRGKVDFFDYLASFVFFHRIRRRSRALDATNTLLFFGLLLISLSPFIYTFASTKGYGMGLVVLSLFIGGVLVVSAVSGYVLLEKD